MVKLNLRALFTEHPLPLSHGLTVTFEVASKIPKVADSRKDCGPVKAEVLVLDFAYGDVQKRIIETDD